MKTTRSTCHGLSMPRRSARDLDHLSAFLSSCGLGDFFSYFRMECDHIVCKVEVQDPDIDVTSATHL
jgi:hypothetical protein